LTKSIERLISRKIVNPVFSGINVYFVIYLLQLCRKKDRYCKILFSTNNINDIRFFGYVLRYVCSTIIFNTFLYIKQYDHICSRRFSEICAEYIKKSYSISCFRNIRLRRRDFRYSLFIFLRQGVYPKSNIVSIGAVYNPQTAISRRAVIACRDGDSGCDISRVDDVSLDTARMLPSTSVSKLRDRDLKRKDKKKEKNWKEGRNEACSNASVRFNSNFRSMPYYASSVHAIIYSLDANATTG